MAMQWLERELRKNKIPGDIERANVLKGILEDRGHDVPFSPTLDDTLQIHGNMGRRSYTMEERPDGSMAQVPVELYQSERDTLTYAASQAELTPDTPQFYAKQVMHLIDSEHNTVSTGAIYKLLNRLERWGYLSSQYEPLDPTIQGPHVRKRFYSITEAGKAKILKQE